MNMENTMKQWTKPCRVALAIGAIAVLAWTVKSVWSAPPPAPAVAWAAVERGDLELSVLATGTLHPGKLVSVGARMSGEVKRLAVREAMTGSLPVSPLGERAT